MYKVPLFFWFDLILEVRAEIFQNCCWYFGRNDVFMKSFRFLLTFSHHDDHGLFPVQPVYCEGQSLQTYSALDQKELVTIIDVDSYQPIIQVKVITYKQKNQQQ